MKRRRFVSGAAGLLVLGAGCSMERPFSDDDGAIDVVLVNATETTSAVEVVVRTMDKGSVEYRGEFEVSPAASERVSGIVADGSYVFDFDVTGKSGGKLEYYQNKCTGGQVTLTVQENSWLRTTHSVCGKPDDSGTQTSPTASPDSQP